MNDQIHDIYNRRNGRNGGNGRNRQFRDDLNNHLNNVYNRIALNHNQFHLRIKTELEYEIIVGNPGILVVPVDWVIDIVARRDDARAMICNNDTIESINQFLAYTHGLSLEEKQHVYERLNL